MIAIRRNDGTLTLYGLACGYVETAQAQGDAEHVMLGAEGAVYFVKCRGVAPCWLTFERDAGGYKQARKAFRELVKRERAWFKPAYRESNPKIDLYDADGRYIASTNWHATCQNALNHYHEFPLSDIAVSARRA